jgi:hypothetical protein
MYLIKKLSLALALVALLAGKSQAVPITGQITLNGGAVISGGSATIGTFTTLTMQSSGLVAFGGGSGSYASITALTPVTFTTNALVVGAPGTTGAIGNASPFYTISVGGFSFDLTAIISNVYNAVSPATRTLNGTGMLHGTGFQDTVGTWQLSTSGTDTTLGFVSTTESVPDTGSTVTLLGMGLLGLAALRRKL